MENGEADSVVSSLGWESLLSQSRFQESIFLKCSERLVRSLRRRMLQLRLPMVASRTPGEMIKQALPGISAKAWQGSEVTTEAGDKLGTKRRFRSGLRWQRRISSRLYERNPRICSHELRTLV